MENNMNVKDGWWGWCRESEFYIYWISPHTYVHYVFLSIAVYYGVSAWFFKIQTSYNSAEGAEGGWEMNKAIIFSMYFS